MTAVSHGTSAKRMADVHAALRCDLRNGSDLAHGIDNRMAAKSRAGGAGRAQRKP